MVVTAAVAALCANSCTRASRPPSGELGPNDAATAITVSPTPDAAVIAVPTDAASAPSVVVDESNIKPDTQSIALRDGLTLTVRTIGTAMIEVSIPDAASTDGKKVEIERRLASPSASSLESDASSTAAAAASSPPAPAALQHDVIEKKSRKHSHAAAHGAKYSYRARLSGGGAWSSNVTVQVPEASTIPPAPTALDVRAETPFSARISFESSSKSLAGFEIQMKGAFNAKDKDAWVRAALLNPTDRTFLHHYRVPKEAVVYRVRAFNALGASEGNPTASVTMPSSPPKTSAAMNACIKPLTAPPKSTGCNPDIDTIDNGSGHPLVNAPTAGNGCRRRLIGEYQGCTREFGAWVLQADIVAVEGAADEGFPLLHAIAGAGMFVGAQIYTLQFSKGRYSLVDEAFFCGEPQMNPDDPTTNAEDFSDLAKCAPPFETCQREHAL